MCLLCLGLGTGYLLKPEPVPLIPVFCLLFSSYVSHFDVVQAAKSVVLAELQAACEKEQSQIVQSPERMKQVCMCSPAAA